MAVDAVLSCGVAPAGTGSPPRRPSRDVDSLPSFPLVDYDDDEEEEEVRLSVGCSKRGSSTDLLTFHLFQDRLSTHDRDMLHKNAVLRMGW